MEVQVTVETSRFMGLLRKIINFKPLDVGAQAGYEYLKQYHRDFAPRWRGDRYMSGGDSGQFAQDVVDGWQPPVQSGPNRTVVTNTFGLLAWKVSGGPIYAQRAQYLTIPVDPSAKGVPVRLYPQPLFRAGNALCIKLGNRVQAIYALKKSVYQQPWPGAMPDQEDIQAAFVGKVTVALNEQIAAAA